MTQNHDMTTALAGTPAPRHLLQTSAILLRAPGSSQPPRNHQAILRPCNETTYQTPEGAFRKAACRFPGTVSIVWPTVSARCLLADWKTHCGLWNTQQYCLK